MQVSVRYSRRLADRIVIAAKMACDENDWEVATLLLATLELAMLRPAPESMRNRRKNLDALHQLREMVSYLQQSSTPLAFQSRALTHVMEEPPLEV
jgi:hypothetical protein